MSYNLSTKPTLEATLTTQDFDTKDGIYKSLKSLEDFNNLLHQRHLATNNGDDTLLNLWLLFGHLLLDARGRVWRFNRDYPDQIPANMFSNIPPVLSQSEYEIFFDMSYCTELAQVPSHTTACKVCGELWSVENCHDTVIETTFQVGAFYHLRCYQLKLEVETRKEYTEVFQAAGYRMISMKAIPNQYRSDSQTAAPWYEVNADGLELTIGYRKRVTEISLKNRPDINLESLFPDEDTTKSKSLIHAWTERKCIEYLQRLNEARKKK